MQGGQHALRVASSSGPSAYDTGAVALAAGAHRREMIQPDQPGMNNLTSQRCGRDRVSTSSLSPHLLKHRFYFIREFCFRRVSGLQEMKSSQSFCDIFCESEMRCVVERFPRHVKEYLEMFGMGWSRIPAGPGGSAAGPASSGSPPAACPLQLAHRQPSGGLMSGLEAFTLRTSAYHECLLAACPLQFAH